jgi:hypothetical protein
VDPGSRQMGKGDKDVKKEEKKTRALRLDFLKKNFDMKIYSTKRKRMKKT